DEVTITIDAEATKQTAAGGCAAPSARRAVDQRDDLRQRPVQLALPVRPAVVPAQIEVLAVRDGGRVESARERQVNLEDDLLDEIAAGVARVIAGGAARRPGASRQEERHAAQVRGA